MNFVIDDFEGPLDLLLHLIKKDDIDIYDIKIEEIANQYLEFINQMESLNLNIASEYLVMASELILLKSRMLLPSSKDKSEDDFEEDPREALIRRLIEYKKYKEVTNDFKDLSDERKNYFTKEPTNLKIYEEENNKVVLDEDVTIVDLVDAFNNLLKRKIEEKPRPTKITKKEISLDKRMDHIRGVLKKKKKLEFNELFDIINKENVVVTFLSILTMSSRKEILIKQEENFKKIYIEAKGDKDE